MLSGKELKKNLPAFKNESEELLKLSYQEVNK